MANAKKQKKINGFNPSLHITPEICTALRQSIETTLLLRTRLELDEKDLTNLFLAARWIKENFNGTKDEQEIVAEWYKRIGKLERALTDE